MAGKHAKPFNSEEVTFAFRLNEILEELVDIKFDADDAGVYAISHKVEEAEGPLRNAMIAARVLNREYGKDGVWT